MVGGLISAHLMSKRGGMDLEPGWPCSGPFLRMAENVARRLLPGMSKLLRMFDACVDHTGHPKTTNATEDIPITKADKINIRLGDISTCLETACHVSLYPPQNEVLLYPPQNEVLGGYTVFSLSVIP